MLEEEKYFLSKEELIRQYVRGDFKQHLTVRHQVRPIPFDHLEQIVLDDPKLSDNHLFTQAYEYLQDLLDEFAYGIPLAVVSFSMVSGINFGMTLPSSNLYYGLFLASYFQKESTHLSKVSAFFVFG